LLASVGALPFREAEAVSLAPPRRRRRAGRAQVADSPRRSWLAILALLVVAGISFAFMQTLVVPALPFFQREFNTSASWATWIATGFLLSSSVLTPILGKLGDSYGKKRLLVISLVIFGVASLGAAASTSLAMLVGFRVLQGAGAAVFPLSYGIIRDEFPPERVGFGVGTVSSVFGVGGGVGLLMSGIILSTLSWPWLFIIGAVPVLVAAALIAVLVPESRDRVRTRPDWVGGSLLSLALVALLLGVSEGNAWGWTSPGVLGLLLGSAALFWAWVRVERRVEDPMVDMTTFTRRGLAVTNGVTFFIGFAMFGSFLLIPGFVQAPNGLPAELASQVDYGFGASLAMTGLFFLPSSILMVLAGPLAGSWSDRVGSALPLRVGLGSIALGVFLVAFFHSAPWTIYVLMCFHGVGIACALSAVGSLVIDEVEASQTGVATGMNSIMRTVGAAFGGQLSAAIVSAVTVPGTAVPSEGGYTLALCVAASAALIGFLLSFAMRPRRVTAR
jgi:EmrB/QacA subfamily drug resistance transporter